MSQSIGPDLSVGLRILRDMAWYDPGGPTKVLAELWDEFRYRQPMADVGMPLNPVDWPGTVTHRWLLCGDMPHTVRLGAIPGGWWTAASWQPGGWLWPSEHDAVRWAERLRGTWPGEWTLTMPAPATVRA